MSEIPNPKMYNSNQYRENWDEIFNKPKIHSDEFVREMTKSFHKAKKEAIYQDKLLTGNDWNELLDYGIIDPDGWDRTTDEYFSKIIDYDDFLSRANFSTRIRNRNKTKF